MFNENVFLDLLLHWHMRLALSDDQISRASWWQLIEWRMSFSTMQIAALSIFGLILL